jgi:hypothetical protein
MHFFITLFLPLIVRTVLGAPTGPVSGAIQVISFGTDAVSDTSVSVSLPAEVLAQLRAQAQGQAKCDPNVGMPCGLFVRNGKNFTG